MPQVEVERHGVSATVRLSGDMANEPWLVQVLRVVADDLTDDRVRRIDLDLGAVTAFDMACLAEVVGIGREVKRAKREFGILAASPPVRRLLSTVEIEDAV